MTPLFVTHWWSLALRGALAILFGVLTLGLPGITLASLILFFGAYALVEGIVNLAGAIRPRAREGRGWTLFAEGLVSVAAGLVALGWPRLTAIAIVLVVATWAVLTGVLEIAAAVRLRKQLHHEWLLALAGIVSIALGVLLFASPASGAFALVLWIGAYAIAFGVLLVLLAFRVRASTHDRHDGHLGPPIPGT